MQLISRYQHLLWKIFPKQKTVVTGHTIEYAVIPQLLLISNAEAKQRFVSAMCLTHRPTGSRMILISSTKSRDPLLKYTLLHEHLGAMALLNFPIDDFDVAWAKTEFTTAITEVKMDATDIEERIRDAIIRKGGRDKEHFFALVIELALMKKELDHKHYRRQLAYALKERF